METKCNNSNILICPWFSLSDREALYCQLFEGNHAEKMNAVRRVDAWKARCYPRVPLGIEVTVSLVAALTSDDCDNKVKPSPGELTSMYCMALVRFVNLVTEVGKINTGGAIMSINSIAEKLGVPEWIVDLRHAAAHSNVPSIPILKIAAVWCLDWVKLHYWIAEKEHIADVVKMPAMFGNESVQNALFSVKKELLTISNCDINDKKHIAKKNEAKYRLNAVMKTIIRCTNRHDLVQILMSDGLLFPESQLSQLHFSEIENDPCLAMHQFELWWPVLHHLGKSGYLVDLIEAFIGEMNRRPRIRGKFSSIWISLLIEKFGLLDKLKTKDWGGYIQLIRTLLKKSPAHAHLAVSHLSKQKMDSLSMLAEKKASFTHRRSTQFDELCNQPNEQLINATNDKIIACPLGMLPEQQGMATLNLDLPMHVDSIYDQQKMTALNDESDNSVAHQDVTFSHPQTFTQPLAEAWLL